MSLNDNVLPPPNHHDFDTFMGNNFVDYTSSYNPEHTLPSPLSPLTMVCNDGRRHDDHMNFASTFQFIQRHQSVPSNIMATLIKN